MFGLFKQKISKREYGQLVVRNALQYLDKTSLGVDLILKQHSEIVDGALEIENNLERIYLIQFASCVAVGELTFYSMDRNGISVYEVRNGFIEHLGNIHKSMIKEHNFQLPINFLKISQDLANIISSNDYLERSGMFFSNEGFNLKDVYGQITIYIFKLATEDFPHLQDLIFETESDHGALRLEVGIDTGFKSVREMYKSYKLI